MTKQEAIYRLKDHMRVHKLNEPQARYINTAHQMAISALEKQIWINVDEKLPNSKSKDINGETYYKDMYVQDDSDNLFIAFYDEEQMKWFRPIGFPVDNVVYWCDCLPEPPKEN